MIEFTRAEILEFERLQADRLFAIARTMTALGLEGEDPDDPRIAGLLERAANECETVDEMIAWIANRRPKAPSTV